MKKRFCWILAVLMLLTGCAAPAAASETEAAQSQEPRGMLLSSMEVPERFTGDWTGVEGLVTVHADASVELPEVDTIPIATVKRRKFTDQDAEKLITFFCGDAPFNQPVYETKQSAQARLERYEAIKRGDEEPTGDLADHIRVEGEAYLDKRIADYQKILETAPDENERILASRKFVPDDFFASEGGRLCGAARQDGENPHRQRACGSVVDASLRVCRRLWNPQWEAVL